MDTEVALFLHQTCSTVDCDVSSTKTCCCNVSYNNRTDLIVFVCLELVCTNFLQNEILVRKFVKCQDCSRVSCSELGHLWVGGR